MTSIVIVLLLIALVLLCAGCRSARGSDPFYGSPGMKDPPVPKPHINPPEPADDYAPLPGFPLDTLGKQRNDQ